MTRIFVCRKVLIPVNPSLSALLNAIDVPKLLMEKKGTTHQIALQPNVRKDCKSVCTCTLYVDHSFMEVL